MQMQAYRVMQRIKNPQTQWNTQPIVDNSQQGVPPGGQPPNAVPGGAAPGGGLGAALQEFTSQPPTPELNPEQPLGAEMGASAPSGESNPMLDALLAARKSSKNKFLGGGNGTL